MRSTDDASLGDPIPSHTDIPDDEHGTLAKEHPQKGEDEVIVVIGGSGGIGRAIVDGLCGDGYYVVATARSLAVIEELQEVAGVSCLYLDLQDMESMKAVINHITAQPYSIRALIHAAGILTMGPLLAQNLSIWKKQFDINVLGPMWLTQQLLPYMVDRGGQIIVLGSDSGLVSFGYSTAYSMTKFALTAMVEGLEQELRDLEEHTGQQTTIHILQPGNISTDIMQQAELMLPRQGRVPEMWLDNYRRFIDKLEQMQRNFLQSPSPATIYPRIQEILEDGGHTQYLQTTGEETQYVLDTLLERVAELNATSGNKLSEKVLLERFRFALDAMDS